jgi:hypothetical protein
MYAPKPEHKFALGLWAVGNPVAETFGRPVMAKLSPADMAYLLGVH